MNQVAYPFKFIHSYIQWLSFISPASFMISGTKIHLFFFPGISFVSENMGVFAQIKILLLKTFSSIWLWIITK